ncbi:MAG: hypothetical protein EZS28_007785 [Streblomastix strix]|uniref:SUEL-type lectin domain-containing protein n=1 Tax=Streblomastix strix TaxID=222440 RepID=A0A5J4WP36_9EUKA|nr:MAG: hypothetical protein EZS28_007785 [Streblomastix strix]
MLKNILFAVCLAASLCFAQEQDGELEEEEEEETCLLNGVDFSGIPDNRIQHILVEESKRKYFFHPCPYVTVPHCANLCFMQDEHIENFTVGVCEQEAPEGSFRVCYNGTQDPYQQFVVDFVCTRKNPPTPGYIIDYDICPEPDKCLYYHWDTIVACSDDTFNYVSIVYIIFVLVVVVLIQQIESEGGIEDVDCWELSDESENTYYYSLNSHAIRIKDALLKLDWKQFRSWRTV